MRTRQKTRTLVAVLVLVAMLSVAVHAASPDDWAGRTIYQVLVDRFAPDDPPSQACSNLSDYCGGTFTGIALQQEYIEDMGFDAVWINPVVVNAPGGYHGYWATDITRINPHYGTAASMQSMVNSLHASGMYVMVGIVANHMGCRELPGTCGTDWTGLVPFNQTAHYHSNCAINNWQNQTQVEMCRLASLPDLAQENAYVAGQLQHYGNNLVSSFGFDGVRFDTVPEVPKWFWTQMQKAVGVYAVGEVFNGDMGYVAGYQGALDATLAYPLFFTLRQVFAQQQSMNELQTYWQQAVQAFENVDLLGVFVDNHDNPRFLSQRNDLAAYRNALVHVLFSRGIPIIYYGTEQAYSGGGDPNCRESLWPNYNVNAPLYKFLASAVAIRKTNRVWTHSQVQRYSDTSFYAFTRGDVFVATTNVGSNGGTVQRTITYHPYRDGTVLCSAFNPSSCVTVSSSGFGVTLHGGMPDILLPKSS